MSDRPADERPMQDARPPPGAVCRIATICNQRGLHARAAARFVKTAGLFDAEIWVRKNGTEVSGRSIMGLMMLAAAPGTVIGSPPPARRRGGGDGARQADRMQIR